MSNDRKEIKRLKKENHDLKKKLYKLEMETLSENEEKSSESSPYNSGSYFTFLLSRMRKKNGFATFEKYFKNSIWVTSILRWGVLIYQYLQTGAFVLLYTAAFILVIPIILAVAAVTLAVTLILRSHNTRLLLKKVAKDIVFLIPDSKEGYDRIFLRQVADEYENATVLVISPFFLRRRGVGDKPSMYVCFRHEYDNVYILRNYFFFYFRRKLKKLQKHNITEIHTSGNKKL